MTIETKRYVERKMSIEKFMGLLGLSDEIFNYIHYNKYDKYVELKTSVRGKMMNEVIQRKIPKDDMLKFLKKIGIEDFEDIDMVSGWFNYNISIKEKAKIWD
jgi:hypothetical protein